jgi:ADP-heptose:LPS heptosyltransferase
MKKVLLIKRGAIGDLLMCTPLVRQLSEFAKVDFLAGKSAGIILKDNKYINKLITVDDKVLTLKGCLKNALILFKLRKQYDYVFVLDKHSYFSVISKILMTKNIGFHRNDIAKYFLSRSVYYYDVNRYQANYYLDLLAVSGLGNTNDEDISLDLVVQDFDVKKIDSFLIARNIKNYVVIVNSGGNNAYEKSGIRMLPQGRILNLIKKELDNDGVTVFLVGGNVDKDNYVKYVEYIGSDRLINLAGELDLSESACLISKAKHFYTTDCGVMHIGIAMAMQNKMTAFFGPTNPAHILPSKFIQDIAVWDDKDRSIYDKNYQLFGKINNSEQFFSQTDI